MESILRAIESAQQGELSEDEEKDETLRIVDKSAPSSPEPLLSFAFRPPQWCIVDKWFSMQVVCSNESIKELEAFVYNSEGTVLPEVLQAEYTNDRLGRKAIVSIDSLRKATFRVKFTTGSKGAWLYIGIAHVNKPDKCLVKSPPIKVQTNRSKRPRDSKKKPIPLVTSLSPSSVPSVGNFPGRKDRMLLIFGENFHLWGNTPVVHLQATLSNKEPMEIRPPNLIWWSENMLECQLPECNSELGVTVSNYDMIFGEGKMLKVVNNQDDSTLEGLKRPSIMNSQLVLEYISGQSSHDLSSKARVLVNRRGVPTDRLQVETIMGTDIVDCNAIQAVIRVYNKLTDEIIYEVPQKCETSSTYAEYLMFTFMLNIPKEKISAASDAIYIAAYLRNENNGKLLIDPFTKQTIINEKPLFNSASSSDDDEDSNSGSLSLVGSSSLMTSEKLDDKLDVRPEPQPPPQILDISLARTSLLNYISKCDDIGSLQKWEQMLDESLQELRAHKQALHTRLQLQQLHREHPQSASQSRDMYSNGRSSQDEVQIISPVAPRQNIKEIRLSNSGEFDDDDDEPELKRGKLNGGETKQEVSLAIPDKQKNQLVYWKFFNPGNRTFLDLVEGKLQIIGSRRIQMLIESLPPSAKFVNAHLYIQKNENFEAIDYCTRCKENGIPNVFCILPRRGREHDYPWITFRITCTSTAKHWKGTLFWIGAEFVVEGATAKYFSPPIYIQSKVKGKDLGASNERPVSPELTRTKSSDAVVIKSSSPSPISTSPSPSPSLGVPVNITNSINANQSVSNASGNSTFQMRAASILEALKTTAPQIATTSVSSSLSNQMLRSRSIDTVRSSSSSITITNSVIQPSSQKPGQQAALIALANSNNSSPHAMTKSMSAPPILITQAQQQRNAAMTAIGITPRAVSPQPSSASLPATTASIPSGLPRPSLTPVISNSKLSMSPITVVGSPTPTSQPETIIQQTSVAPTELLPPTSNVGPVTPFQKEETSPTSIPQIVHTIKTEPTENQFTTMMQQSPSPMSVEKTQ